jgi:hypothetical protein
MSCLLTTELVLLPKTTMISIQPQHQKKKQATYNHSSSHQRCYHDSIIVNRMAQMYWCYEQRRLSHQH